MTPRSLIYLLGGGPSAAEVDTSLLSGFVVGVNDAAFHKPCHAFFSNDHGYCLGIRDKIEAYPGERHLAVRWKFHGRFEGWNVRMWKRWDWRDPAMSPGELSSGPQGTPGCSGYVALNLAAQMGARRIVLLGYDFHEPYGYFFSDSPYPRVSVAEVIASFREVAPWYRQRGIEILNANPESAIDAFRKIAHDEAFEIA